MRLSLAGAILMSSIGCTDDGDDFGHLGRAWPTSDLGVAPRAFDGNFVASDDDQVCYELDRVLGRTFTEEMKGIKIDPPESTTRPEITVVVDQPTLGFVASEGYRAVGVIVKGADAYNAYDYRDAVVVEDSHLRSPYKNDKIPAISHYNVCTARVLVTVDDQGEQGCTPGYWRNHLDRWLGVLPADDFDAVFRAAAFDPNITLGAAINLAGGGKNALARHATAALLNAYGGVPSSDDASTVAYPLQAARVISLVRSALASGDSAEIEATKATLDAYNNLGCPLHGTPAT